MPEMDPEAGASSQRRAFPRVPLRAKARMEFAEQRCFLSEWAVNLSPGGMFVRSEAPMAAGQRFHFEASLSPKGPRFDGVGEVTWVRGQWEGTARPPGFAVRFLELEEEGRLAMIRLAEIFLDHGVAAMHEALQSMAADWQRRRLDDETTDELIPAEQPEEPLPDTAVFHAPWPEADGIEDEIAAKLTEVEEGRSPGSVAALGDEAPGAAADPLAVEPAPQPGEARRRRVWWVGVLALALGGTGYLALRGPLTQRSAGGSAAAAAAVAPLPAAAPGDVPASARGLDGTSGFAGLQDVTWREEGEGLWVVLALEGTLPAEALRRFRPGQDPPREVIQMLGAQHGYPRAVVPVNSPLLEQIRVGFHPGAGDELRVVFDLGSKAVVVRSMQNDGRALRFLLVREAATAAAAPIVDAAAPAAATETAPGPVAAEPHVAPTGAAASPNISPQ